MVKMMADKLNASRGSADADASDGEDETEPGSKEWVQEGDEDPIEDTDVEGVEDAEETVVKKKKKKKGQTAKERRAWLSKVAHMDDEVLFSGRVGEVVNQFQRIQEDMPGDKVAIFSKFREFLDLVAEGILRKCKLLPLRFDGSASETERSRMRDVFDDITSLEPILITPGAGRRRTEPPSSQSCHTL